MGVGAASSIGGSTQQMTEIPSGTRKKNTSTPIANLRKVGVIIPVVVDRPTREQHLCADKAYDATDFRDFLILEGYTPTLGGGAHSVMVGETPQHPHQVEQESLELVGVRSVRLRPHSVHPHSIRPRRRGAA